MKFRPKPWGVLLFQILVIVSLTELAAMLALHWLNPPSFLGILFDCVFLAVISSYPLLHFVVLPTARKIQQGDDLAKQSSTREQLELAIEGTNSGFWDWDVRSGKVLFSPQWKRMLGYEPEDLKNDFSTWTDLLHPDDREEAAEYVKSFLGGSHRRFQLEFRLRTKEGEFRWILSQAAALRDREGAVMRLTGWHIDITERRTERDLLREVTSNIHEVFWKTDLEKNAMLFVSSAYEKVWGRTVRSLFENPRQFVEAVVEEDRPRILDFLQRQLKGEAQCEYRIRTPEGQLRWIFDRAFPVRNRKGVIVGTTGIASDVTARKETERLIESERSMRESALAADSFDDSLSVITSHLHASLAGTRLLVLEPDSARENLVPCFAAQGVPAPAALPLAGPVVHPCQEAAASREITNCLDLRRHPRHPEYRLLAESTGTDSCLSVPLLRTNGGLLAVIAALKPTLPPFDTEEIRQILDAGQLIAVLLKRREDKLAAELARAKAFTNAKMASLGEMAAGIAHEINNPLAIVLGKASQLRRGLGGQDAGAASIAELEKIEKAAQRISGIVRSMRQLSRGEGTDQPVRLSIEDVVRDAMEISQERFRREGIQVELFLQATPGVLGNPGALEQVIVNLLLNALDAVRGKPGAFVKVETWRDGNEALLAVSDSGPGIPIEIAEKIMQPFFTTKAAGQGTGLGLSISREIVQRLGGSLSLDRDHPNTRFVVRLPAA